MLLVLAAFIAIVAALAVSESGRNYLHHVDHSWNHTVRWVQDLFS